MAERLRDINPKIELTIVSRFIKDDETDALLDSDNFDYVVDAIDTLSPKLALIKGALDRQIPLVSSMGAGAKTDPAKMEICDIAKTHHCPLAHMLRKRLHKIGVRKGFTAVFSPEPVREGAMILCEEQNKKSNMGHWLFYVDECSLQEWPKSSGVAFKTLFTTVKDALTV